MNATAATGSGAEQVSKSFVDELDLDLTDETKNNSAKSQNVKNSQPAEAKKVKVTLEIEVKTLEELKVLTTLGVYESKEDFIYEAITEKKDEVMNRLRLAVKKK